MDVDPGETGRADVLGGDAVDRVLQSHTFGPHRLDVVEYPDDEGGGLVVVLIDDVVVTDPPLPGEPSVDEIMHIYATWQAGTAGR